MAWQLARALQGSSRCTPPLGWGLEGSGEYLNETTTQQGLVGKALAAKDGSEYPAERRQHNSHPQGCSSLLSSRWDLSKPYI